MRAFSGCSGAPHGRAWVARLALHLNWCSEEGFFLQETLNQYYFFKLHFFVFKKINHWTMAAVTSPETTPQPRVYFQTPPGTEEEVPQKQGRVTVKYDRKELRRRLNLEEWIVSQLMNLYDCEVRHHFCCSLLSVLCCRWGERKNPLSALCRSCLVMLSCCLATFPPLIANNVYILACH